MTMNAWEIEMQEARQVRRVIDGAPRSSADYVRRGIRVRTLSAALAAALAAGPLATLAQNVQNAQNAQNAPADGWAHPTTSWGDPDLQGNWPIRHMTLTPLERPVELGTRAFLTDEEFAARAESIEARNTRY